ncbi:phage portal protein [Paracoccus sp. p1-h21]|uniref:phage portal protein n=1 Tax=Paracoccus sp. p1-h21 TaxID=3366951 RepID=UPI00379D0973
MGILDRFRTRKAEPARVRSFDGAAGGRRASGRGQFGRINPEVAAAAPSLRSRAAYLAHNNPWLNQACANWTGALVGAGIVPTSKHTDPAQRKAINAYFENWASDSDAEGRSDFWGQQAVLADAMVKAGESVALILDTEDGPRLRIIPSDLLDESKTGELSDDRSIFSGVELDANGKRLAYWIVPEKPGNLFAQSQSVRVDAGSVLHVFKPLAPGQVRGVSWLAPVILPAGDFDQLCDALLVGAKVAAMHTGFITDLNGTADAYDDQGDVSLEPGALRRLGMGQDVKFNTPGQLQQVEAFLKLNLRQLAAGLGLPDHLLSGDLTGANYSSLRAGLLPFRTRVEQIQYGVLVPQFLAPVWRKVIAHGVLSGDLDAPDFERNPAAYLTADWLPPKHLQVDPLKDINATIAELDAGLTSRRKAVAERGWNLDDLDAEIAAEKQAGGSDEKA